MTDELKFVDMNFEFLTILGIVKMTGKFPLKRYFGYSGVKCIDTEKSKCLKLHKTILILFIILRLALIIVVIVYVI